MTRALYLIANIKDPVTSGQSCDGEYIGCRASISAARWIQPKIPILRLKKPSLLFQVNVRPLLRRSVGDLRTLDGFNSLFRSHGQSLMTATESILPPHIEAGSSSGDPVLQPGDNIISNCPRNPTTSNMILRTSLALS